MKAKDYIGNFNPKDIPEITDIKAQAINMIDTILALPNEDHRRKAIACTKIEEAAMMAVKSIFS